MSDPRPARVFVGLGSNMDDPLVQVRAALEALANRSGWLMVRQSRLYRSAPWGEVEQPPFVNAVAEVLCDDGPRAVLSNLLDIERDQGRIRSADRRWGPRIIDLDLLLYDDVMLDEPGLVLPHPYLHRRAFVLMPLHELEPELIVPGRGSVASLLAQVDTTQCAVIA